MTLYNYSGRQLMEVTLTKAESVIDLSSFPPGLYIAIIKGQNRVSPFKVLKE